MSDDNDGAFSTKELLLAAQRAIDGERGLREISDQRAKEWCDRYHAAESQHADAIAQITRERDEALSQNANSSSGAKSDTYEGCVEQHHRDSTELRRLCAERDQARRTAEYRKAEYNAANEAIANLTHENERLTRERDQAVKDSLRLDWLIEQQAWIQWTERDGSIRQCQVMTQDEDENYHVPSGEHRFFSIPREAIDAALSAPNDKEST